MSRLIFVLLGFVFLATVQGDHRIFDEEFTDTGKKCIKDNGIDETKLRALLLVYDIKMDETDEIIKKFFSCCFDRFISDNNEIIVDDKFDTYVTNFFTGRIGGKHKLAELLAKDCIRHCEHEKGDTKDHTATKVGRCILKRFDEFMENDHHD